MSSSLGRSLLFPLSVLLAGRVDLDRAWLDALEETIHGLAQRKNVSDRRQTGDGHQCLHLEFNATLALAISWRASAPAVRHPLDPPPAAASPPPLRLPREFGGGLLRELRRPPPPEEEV